MFRKSVLMISAVLVFSAILPIGNIATAAAPAHHYTQNDSTDIISGHPVNISIPSLGINIPVVDGVYDMNTAKWTLNHATSQFATSTPEPNDATGNTFIYGHNNHLVFKALLDIQPDAEVQIATSNGRIFYYQFTDSIDITPAEVSTIVDSTLPILTVQTCVGDHYQYRRMFHFSFIKVEKV